METVSPTFKRVKTRDDGYIFLDIPDVRGFSLDLALIESYLFATE